MLKVWLVAIGFYVGLKCVLWDITIGICSW